MPNYEEEHISPSKSVKTLGGLGASWASEKAYEMILDGAFAGIYLAHKERVSFITGTSRSQSFTDG